ncbi:MAG: hypothetical protein K6G17_04165, partial [Oscillospiraceae bacterium]|nr:hypothetical protein [Oscillospiraceae bacterium]
PTPAPTPAPTPEPTPEPTPVPTAPPAAAPEKELLPSSFFDDAAFVGVGCSGALEYYANNSEGALGTAQFLVLNNYSLRGASDGKELLFYSGGRMKLEQAVEAAGVNKLFIMLGAGDLAEIDAGTAAWEMARLVTHVRRTCPDVEIFLQSEMPVAADAKDPDNALIDEYNAELRKVAAKYDCCYVEIGAHFKGEDGALDASYLKEDGSMTIEAGETWAGLLRDPDNYSDSPQG